MASKIGKAVFDTSPLIHLNEVGLLRVLKLFKVIFIAGEVVEELSKNRALHAEVKQVMNIKPLQLKSTYKDMSKLMIEKYGIDFAESSSIALSIQEKTGLFITDDLDARTVAKSLNIEVHGTLGLIARAYREKIISEETAIGKINELHEKSSLFITKDLVERIIKDIKSYKGK